MSSTEDLEGNTAEMASESAATATPSGAAGGEELRRELRSSSKWWDTNKNPPEDQIREDRPHPLRAYSQEEWASNVERLQTFSAPEKRAEYEKQLESYDLIYVQEAVPRMQSASDLSDVLEQLERRYYIIRLLYEHIYTTDEDIAKYNKACENLSRVKDTFEFIEQARRDGQDQECDTEHGDEEEVYGDQSSMQRSQNFSMDDMLVQAIDNALIEYVEKPDDPRWKQEAREIEEGKDVRRDVAIRRYLIDCALLRVFSKEAQDHWTRLLKETGKEVFEKLVEIWDERFANQQGTSHTDTMGKTLRFVLFSFGPKRVNIRLPETPISASSHSASGVSMDEMLRSSSNRSDPPPSRTYSAPNTQPSHGTTSRRTFPATLSSTTASSAVGTATTSSLLTVTSKPFAPSMAPPRTLPSSSTAHHPTLSGVGTIQPPSVEQLLLKTATLLQGVSTQVSNRQQGAGSNTSGSSLKLPAVEIGKYDGNPLSFMDWWMRFEPLVHNNSRLSDSEKLIFLIQHVEAKAQQKCWGQGVDTLDYKQALGKVYSTFANAELLTSLFLDKIQAQRMPKDENDISGIRDLVNTTQKMVNCLDHVKIHPMEYSRMTMLCFKDRIPFNLQMKMVDKIGKKISEMTLTEYISALDVYCSVREDVSDYLKYKTSNRQGNSSPGGSGGPSRSTTMTGQSQPKIRFIKQRWDPETGYPECVFCGVEGRRGHKWKDCPVTDPGTRLEKFNEWKLCLACGNGNHNSGKCQSKLRCPKCNGFHHIALHDYFIRANQDTSGGGSPPQRQPPQQHQPPPPPPPSGQPQAGGHQPQEGNANPGAEQPARARSTYASANKDDKTVILGVLKGDLSYPGKPKRVIPGNLFLDGGSDTSYITKDCARKLGLPVMSQRQVAVDIFGGGTAENLYPVTQVRISSRKGQALIDVYITDKITRPLDMTNWKESAKKAFPNHSFPQLQSETFPVDILIGMDHINDVRGSEIGRADKLVAMNSILGPYLEGHYKKPHNEESSSLTSTWTLTTTSQPMPTPSEDYHYTEDDEKKVSDFDFDKAESLLERFFADEDFTASDDKDPTKDELLQKFMEATRLIDTPQGKAYEVPFLWKNKDSKTKLKSNFNLALAFLHRLTERLKEKGMLEACNKVVEAAIANGYYEVVETNPTKGHHIPTFFVEQPNSTSTPVRHVIAANMGNPPLNSQLETGINLLADLPTLIRRFRAHKTGLTADISKAYHQLVVREEDRDFMKMLWFRNGELITLRLARIPFGTCLAPFQLFATLFKHLTTHEHEDAKPLNDVLYNDNVVTSVKQNELDYALNAVAILGDGGFTLRKFSTNSEPLQKELEQRNLLNIAERETTRVLGMKWDLKEDTLSFCRPSVPTDNEKVTRRSILHQLPRHYDPIGIMSPILIPGVNFISQMCDKKYDWDEPLSEEDATRWKNIYAEVQKAMEFKGVPRHHDFDPEKPVRLHVFSDASTSWGGVSAYLTQEGKSALVAAKAKIPPKRLRVSGITVPRRELEALTVGAKIMAKLLDTYKPIYGNIEPHMYSDSEIVLNWVVNDGKVNAFVDNRVRQIKELTPNVPLHYVNTADNPSDPVSRGMTAEEYLDPNHLYWTGPALMHMAEIPPFKPSKSDLLKSITLTASANPAPSILNLVEVDKCQSLAEVKRRLAAVITCTRRWRKQEPLNARAMAKHVTMELIKAEQQATIPQVVEYLKTQEGPRPSSVHPFSLFLKEGIVRVGGRLGNANLPFAHRYPIYLTRDSPLFALRVMEFHQIALHSGHGVTRAKMQREYWIPRSSRAIKSIIRSCYRCKRASGPPFRWPQAPDLPEERVNPATPYNVIGCDLTGHFLVQTEHGTEKVYVALFSDTSTRHISVEVLDNMETTTFLASLRRHSATHGTPQKIISDRATYFIKSSSVLGEKLGEEFCNEVARALEKRGIHWQFNPAASPHMGGHYERLIGLLKTLLKRTIGRSLLDKTEFITLTKEAACIANSRILGVDNPSSHRDRLPITPNHLVHGREISPLPYGEGDLDEEEDPSYELTDDEVVKQWRRLASRLIAFKEQFAEEYLQQLRMRHQNDHHGDPVEVAKIGKGDLVLMRNDLEKRALWDLALVLEILPSNDGKARAVRLKTKNGECTRPIIKLHPLLTAEQLDPTNGGQDQEPEPEHQEDQPDEATSDQPAADEVPTPPASPPPSPPPSRPQRAAKNAARTWLQGVTRDLLDD